MGMAWPGSWAPMVPLAVLLALVIDRLWGEPPTALHPVAWMGTALGAMGRRVAPRFSPDRAGLSDGPRFLFGALAWLLGAGGVVALAWGVQAVSTGWAWGWAGLWLALWLKPLMAWRMLREEVASVEKALGQSLADGRARLAWLVSRDVTTLDARQVRESAIETLAENLNDSVVAPLFWFAVAGLPGAALYRFANTADAMWGYRGEREGRDWTWAGKWAARADDVLSWVPARITAVLLAVWGRAVSWKTLAVEARRTDSPNSGWPMAAMALVLGVQLGKPGAYTLNPQGRHPEGYDTARAIRAGRRVVCTLAGLALLWCSCWLLPRVGGCWVVWMGRGAL